MAKMVKKENGNIANLLNEYLFLMASYGDIQTNNSIKWSNNCSLLERLK
jgi:hypothetical protein